MGVQVQCRPQRVGTNRGRLQLTYTVRGDIHRLRLPAVCEPGPADGLWAHTCFEAFFSEPAAPAYHEFNFSPSTQWAHYRFREERVRDALWIDRTLPPHVQMPPGDPTQWVLTASVDATPLGDDQPGTWFAPTAVLEMNDGSLSYWAMSHPAPRPDFHNRTGWTTAIGWAIA
jgi:hypothetical protein